MIRKRCYRHLDRPFVVFLGLGPIDLMAILLLGVILILFANPIVAILGAVGLAVALKKLKEGKPRGDLFYVIYRSGLICLVPDRARPPYLVKPPALGGSHLMCLSGVPSDPKDEPEEARFYRGPRKFVLDTLSGEGRAR